MKKVFFFVLSFALIAGLYTIFANKNRMNVDSGGPLMTEPQFRDKLAEYRMERDKLQRHIEQLDVRKKDAIEKIKAMKITKVSEAKGNPDAEVQIRNLKSSTEKIEDLKSQFTHYDNAISRISGMLDKLEQDRIHSEVKLTEAQEIELRAIVADLDERLGLDKNDPLLDAELDKLLSNELKD